MIIIQLKSEELIAIVKSAVNDALEKANLVAKTQPEQEQLLSVEEAATFLRITAPTLRNKVSMGEIPAMKQGKRLYFSRTELVEHIKSGRKKTNAEIEQQVEAYISRKRKGLRNGK